MREVTARPAVTPYPFFRMAAGRHHYGLPRDASVTEARELAGEVAV